MEEWLKKFLCKHGIHRWRLLDTKVVYSMVTPWLSNTPEEVKNIMAIEKCDRCFKQQIVPFRF